MAKKISQLLFIGMFIIAAVSPVKGEATDPSEHYVYSEDMNDNGKIDLWPSIIKSGLYKAKLMGLGNEIEPITNILVSSDDIYIAFNKKTSDEIVQLWQSTFDKLLEQGKVASIIKSYE